MCIVHVAIQKDEWDAHHNVVILAMRKYASGDILCLCSRMYVKLKISIPARFKIGPEKSPDFTPKGLFSPLYCNYSDPQVSKAK